MTDEHGALIDEIVRLTRELKNTDHIGRNNRLIQQRGRIFEQIAAGPGAADRFRTLLNHPDPDVLTAAAWHCGWSQIMLDEAEHAITALAANSAEAAADARDWMEAKPRMAAAKPTAIRKKKRLSFPGPPAVRSRETVVGLVASRFRQARAAEIGSLVRRAILLQPAEYGGDPLASRLGGLPMMPARTAWPIVEDEPLLFLGQINCSELRAAIGDTLLPDRGLLLFFGDHDEVHGCGPNLGGAVIYASDPRGLKAKPPPVDDFEPHVQCGLRFHETWELPDPRSNIIDALSLKSADAVAYKRLHAELKGGGTYDTDRSKLLGWPDLIQGDLAEEFFSDIEPDDILLAQLGSYHDGWDWQSWGPGGLVYFLIREQTLAEHDFSEAHMTVQCT